MLSDQAPLTEAMAESSAGLAGLAPLPLDLSNVGETFPTYPRGQATDTMHFPLFYAVILSGQ